MKRTIREDEQHASVFRQYATVHEPCATLRIGARHFRDE
jgi:hypothetical protein